MPMHSLTTPFRGLQWVTGDASVRPYPSTSRPEQLFRTVRARGKPRRDLRRVGDEIAVGQHRAFRGARRSARVLKDRHVVEAGSGLRRRTRRRPSQVREPVNPGFMRDVEGPMALLLEVPPLLDGI